MEQNEINKGNKTKLFILTLVILLVSVAGISYAYFTIQITGNDTASSMRVRTANKSLVYNDVQIVSDEYIEPGWSDTKTLTVTNNGNVTVDYTIKFRELVNTIINGELVLSATCSASSGSCSNLPERAVHAASTEITDAYMYGPISIAPGVTHTYTLTVLFKETGSNQNYNQNKYFNGTLNLGDGSATPETCFTTSGEFNGDYTKNSITGYTCSSTDIIVPEEIDGKPVVRMGKNSLEGKNLTSVVFPNSVISFGNSSLKGNQLTSLVIPDNTTVISTSAFSTNLLQSIVIPGNVAKIDNYAFENNSLLSATISEGVSSIGAGAFQNNQLISLKIPNSVSSIDYDAFKNNQLTSVVLSNSINKLSNSIFYNNNLSNITIPNTVTSIGNSALRDNQLTSVVIPNGVTTIGNNAFQDNQLTSAVIPNGVTQIGTSAFGNNKLTSIVIPNGVTSIGNNAFINNEISSPITIPSSVTTIGNSAFQNNQISSITFNEGLVTLNPYAFNQNAISTLTIPSSVTALNNNVFSNNRLESVTILGKSSSSQFATYGSNIWGWKSGITCTTNNTSNVTNGCITWGA